MRFLVLFHICIDYTLFMENGKWKMENSIFCASGLRALCASQRKTPRCGSFEFTI